MAVAVTHIAAEGVSPPTSPRDVPGTHTFVAGNYYVIISTSQANASALTLQPPSGGALSLVDSFNATNLGTSGFNVLGRVYLCTTGATGTASITFTSGLNLIAYAIAEVSGSDGITQTTSVQTTDTTSISPTGISGVGADDRAVWLVGGSTGGNINVSGATRLTQANLSGRRAVVIHDTDGSLTISNFVAGGYNAVKGYRFHAAPPPNTCVVSMW